MGNPQKSGRTLGNESLDQLNFTQIANNNPAKQPGTGELTTSSWYDFDKNGKSNQADLNIITQNFGKNCLKKN